MLEEERKEATDITSKKEIHVDGDRDHAYHSDEDDQNTEESNNMDEAESGARNTRKDAMEVGDSESEEMGDNHAVDIKEEANVMDEDLSAKKATGLLKHDKLKNEKLRVALNSQRTNKSAWQKCKKYGLGSQSTKKFSAKNGLRKDKSGKESGEHRCGVCLKKFPSNRGKLKHYKLQHTVKKQFPCLKCDKVFTSRNGWSKHKRNHDEPDAHKSKTCKWCGVRFRSNVKCKEHEEICWKVFCFNTRDKCIKFFTTSDGLDNHKLACEKVFCLSCNKCGKFFTTSDGLDNHKLACEKVFCFTCDTCGKFFTTSDGLDNHKLACEKVFCFTCDNCGKFFTTSDGLDNHKLACEKVFCFTCDTCGKFFTTSDGLDDHKLACEKVFCFTCDTCGKFFTTSDGLDDHKLACEKVFCFTCDTCGKFFTTSDGLDNHKLAEHSTTSDGLDDHKLACEKVFCFTCDTCGKFFTTSDGLDNHKLAEHSTTSDGLDNHKLAEHSTPSDGLDDHKLAEHSTTSDGLDNHKLAEHSTDEVVIKIENVEDDTYEGSVNLPKFNEESREEQNNDEFIEKISTPEPSCSHKVSPDTQASKAKIMCQYCDKTFVQRKNVIKHIKNHKESDKMKNFECTMCEKHFQTAHKYADHLKNSHFLPEERPYKCATCEKAFADMKQLAKHLRTNHLPDEHKPLRCGTCGKGFFDKCAFNVHLKRHLVQKKKKKPGVDCEYCGEHFTMKTVLHVSMHLEEVLKGNTVHWDIFCVGHF